MNLRAGAVSPRRLVGIVASVVLYTLAGVAAFLLWPTSLGGCTTLTIVSGHSMEPTYYTGDLVVARCATASVGDVIVYQPKDLGGARIIHRITGGDATSGWVMKGDNNASADPFNPAGSEVLGVAKVYLPKVGLIARGLTSPFVWGSFILIAIGLFIWPRRDDEDSTPTDDVESAVDVATAVPATVDSVATDIFATSGSTPTVSVADAIDSPEGEQVHDETVADVPTWVLDSVPDSVRAPAMGPR
jgi:signal peptidase